MLCIIHEFRAHDAEGAPKATRTTWHSLEFFDDSAALRFVQILRQVAVVLKITHVDELVHLLKPGECRTLDPFALHV